ncbi:hypothetical protein KTAU_04820 [Thermogemmatispora aurantia]|uniref:Uncharacterized protein n=1 Tax=Thermogemmatispora aurantia TaxID=2045279 RepID=A0A5J4JWN6_9CHLR|nr:hypothetical protein KTAU_04820 [Thermogemmatispora aurantia]
MLLAQYWLCLCELLQEETCARQLDTAYDQQQEVISLLVVMGTPQDPSGVWKREAREHLTRRQLRHGSQRWLHA